MRRTETALAELHGAIADAGAFSAELLRPPQHRPRDWDWHRDVLDLIAEWSAAGLDGPAIERRISEAHRSAATAEDFANRLLGERREDPATWATPPSMDETMRGIDRELGELNAAVARYKAATGDAERRDAAVWAMQSAQRLANAGTIAGAREAAAWVVNCFNPEHFRKRAVAFLYCLFRDVTVFTHRTGRPCRTRDEVLATHGIEPNRFRQLVAELHARGLSARADE